MPWLRPPTPRLPARCHLPSRSPTHPGQNYTDTLTAASAVQREAESLGSDLEAVLSLVASRSQSLLRASGAAIALAAKDPGTMICRASAGPSAPPVGATLQVGSGFSGECVRTGRMLRCDDTETDERVDPQSCRALGIRSMLAAPVRLGERVVGLLEVFSAQPSAFGENDSAVLQRFAETIVAAVNRAVRVHQPAPAPASPQLFRAAGSILFAREPEPNGEKKRCFDRCRRSGRHSPASRPSLLPRRRRCHHLSGAGLHPRPMDSGKAPGPRTNWGTNRSSFHPSAAAGHRCSANLGHRNGNPRPTPPVRRQRRTGSRICLGHALRLRRRREAG